MISNAKACLPLILPLLLLTGFMIRPASAQSSIGFAEPDDVEALLEYRLPTWSYRICTVNGSLQGSGRDRDNSGEREIGNRFSTFLSSHFTWRRMSETDERDLAIAGYGHYSRYNSEYGSRSSTGHALDGTASLAAGIRRFLSPGGAWGGVSISSTHSYHEDVDEFDKSSLPGHDDGYRYYMCSAEATAGIGRVRDVTPIIRAQRISERLHALGRPEMTGSQIRRVAAVLAQEGVYRTVFDRSEKNFWRDLLGPILDGQEPLTPYEVLYLRDVMVETLGTREQGREFGLVTSYRVSPGSDTYDIGVFASWAHNLSLTQQLSAEAYATYRRFDYGDGGREHARLLLRLGHLWMIADRYDLRTSLSYDNDRYLPDEWANRQDHFVRLEPEFRIYIEDSLALVTTAMLDYSSMRIRDESMLRHGWQWSYGISLEYALDRVLN